MLIPNLAVLLAERRLTISKVSEDTRISRTTLTSLAGRSAKGIQFDTLNTLCQYLRISPGELFSYRPFDLSASAGGLPGRGSAEFTLVRAGALPERCCLDCEAEYLWGPAAADGARTLNGLRVRLAVPAGDDRAAALAALLQQLPKPALSDLELQLLSCYDRNIDPALCPDDYSPYLLWPWQ